MKRRRIKSDFIEHPLTFHPTAQPRAIGAAHIAVRADDGVTRLANLRQAGCSKLILPRMHRPGVEAVLVNTSGGITGGDDLSLAADVGAGAALTITTQAAERAYRAVGTEVAQMRTRLTVAQGARMHWLPQEMILFDACALDRRLDIDLAADAELLMVEPLVFGRAAMGEVLTAAHFNDRITVTRDGRPVYLDGLRLTGDVAGHLARAGIAGGAGAMASVLLVRPDATRWLDPIRAMLPQTAGASLLAEDMLVIRHLAPDSHALRKHLVPVLQALTDNTLPISWRL